MAIRHLLPCLTFLLFFIHGWSVLRPNTTATNQSPYIFVARRVLASKSHHHHHHHHHHQHHRHGHQLHNSSPVEIIESNPQSSTDSNEMRLPTGANLSPPVDEGNEIDPRYGVEKRLVPTGPNPLHH